MVKSLGQSFNTNKYSETNTRVNPNLVLISLSVFVNNNYLVEVIFFSNNQLIYILQFCFVLQK